MLLKAIALLPFGVLYTLSDFLFFLNKYVFKYRSAVVAENLAFAFPEKTEEERAEIREKFYHHFFDFSLESVKLYGLSAEEMEKRVSFSGVENWDHITSERNGSIVLAGHYNNWEWTTFVQSKMTNPILMVYNPPRDNKPMEDFLKKMRGKWGGMVLRTGWAARTTIRMQRSEEPAALWLGADQTALATSPHWTIFLNREAAFFSGPIRIAKKTNHPVFFQYIKKVGRGKYHADFSLLIEEPAKVDEADILRAYVNKLEEHIKEVPEYYLWSHRRWKHTRPEGIGLME